jgi:hypothetical protein
MLRDGLGDLFFRDLAKLTKKPDLYDRVADYTSDRIVFHIKFHIEDNKDDVVAPVSPGFPCPCIYFVDPDGSPGAFQIEIAIK